MTFRALSKRAFDLANFASYRSMVESLGTLKFSPVEPGFKKQNAICFTLNFNLSTLNCIYVIISKSHPTPDHRPMRRFSTTC